MAQSDIWRVYLFLIPVVLLFLSDCLLNYDTLSVFVIMIPRVSVLLWYGECLHYYDILPSPFLVMSTLILIPWVPMLLWYLECLPYYDIWTRYHNNADKCVYLIMISGVSSLLWYTVLNDRSTVYAIMIGGVSI